MGITGIYILVIIMFLVDKFRFSESPKGRQLIYVGFTTKEENTTTLKVDTWLSAGLGTEEENEAYRIEAEEVIEKDI